MKKTICALIAATTVGCVEAGKTNYNGYEAVAIHGNGYKVVLRDTAGTELNNRVSGHDADGDWVFEDINVNVPEGHPLIQYANQDSIRKAYQLAIQAGNE